MDQLLGEVEVAQEANEPTDQAAGLLPEDPSQRRVGRRSLIGISGLSGDGIVSMDADDPQRRRSGRRGRAKGWSQDSDGGPGRRLGNADAAEAA